MIVANPDPAAVKQDTIFASSNVDHVRSVVPQTLAYKEDQPASVSTLAESNADHVRVNRHGRNLKTTLFQPVRAQARAYHLETMQEMDRVRVLHQAKAEAEAEVVA